MTVIALQDAQPPFILVIDIGTSSLRALVYDAQGNQVQGMSARQVYAPRTTADGGSELDAEEMWSGFSRVVDEVVALTTGRIHIAAVAVSSLASNILGIDHAGSPLTPAYLYADTRNAPAVEWLRARYDWLPIYARTGCPLHTSYVAPRMVWLRDTQRDLFAKIRQWVSLHEFFLLRLFGRTRLSHSMASWMGMFNHARLDWDDQVLEIAGVQCEQLSPPEPFAGALRGLKKEFAARWKALADVPFFPAVGDGAAANLGSGCDDETRVAITVGTSGAMRVVLPIRQPVPVAPKGLWLYRVDERRGLLGGSLTDGGSVFAYLRQVLQLPDPAQLDRELIEYPPDSHGLTWLPFFGGERSPGYHGEARAALTGWKPDTKPIDILRAAMEAIAYRFALIYNLLREAISLPREIVASGAALLNSRAWVQILADVLGEPITISQQEEASARGVALMALEALGADGYTESSESLSAERILPDQAHHEIYQAAMARQIKLYDLLLED